MGSRVDCDHCKQPIAEVAYAVTAVAPDRLTGLPITGPTWLHWLCIGPWVGRENTA